MSPRYLGSFAKIQEGVERHHCVIIFVQFGEPIADVSAHFGVDLLQLELVRLEIIANVPICPSTDVTYHTLGKLGIVVVILYAIFKL